MDGYKFDIRFFMHNLSRYAYSLLPNDPSARSVIPTCLVEDVRIDELGNYTWTAGLPLGTTFIPYKDKQLIFSLKETDAFVGVGGRTQHHREMFVEIKANNRDEALRILNQFTTDAMIFNQDKREKTISVQIYRKDSSWTTISHLPQRPLDTIYMDEKDKEKIISDVRNFILEEEEYRLFGIPYKRCYLFQGTPGTGKTSLIFAIASLLNRGISIFNFSTEITDTIFLSAISNLDSNHILVLEDLDALFINRTSTGVSHVSFSCLLNVLDGVCRKNKLITFLTTNHLERLDKALLRPGRVDYILQFDYAKKEQIKQMYLKFLPSQSHNFEKFYSIIGNHKVSMALIQKFLFEHRQCVNENGSILKYEKELVKLILDFETLDKDIYL